MPGCTFTFHSVVQRMQEHANAFLINPAVGVLAHIIPSPQTLQVTFASKLDPSEMCVCALCVCSAGSHQWLLQDEGRQRH